jgi:hypothetical protein
MALDPEHQVVGLLPGEFLDADRQSITGGVPVRIGGLALDEPAHVRADPALVDGDAVRPHDVFCRVGQRRVDRYAEPLDQAPRVALVPRRREHDSRLPVGRDLFDLRRGT